MNKLNGFLLCVVAFAASASFPAHAEVGSGRIVGYIPYASGGKEVLIVRVENTSGTRPSCNSTSRFAISSDSLNFKATQSAVMAAYAAGTRVYLSGKGTCSAWSNSEDFGYICVGDISC